MKRLVIALLVLVVVGVAYMHWLLPAQIEAPRNVVLPHEPYAISEAAQRLHDSLFIADLHSDSLLWKRDLSRRSDVGHMDLPRLRQGNVGLQVFSATTKSPSGQNYESNSADSDRITLLAIASLWPPRTWFSLYERAVYQLDKLHKLVDDEPLVLIRNKQNLEDVITRRESGDPELFSRCALDRASTSHS